MIKFESVTLHNFLSVEDRHVKLDTPGLTLVVGKNGAGKSAQYSESLVWALFGTTIRPLAADEVIRKGADECRVEVAILVDGTPFLISREKTRGRAAVLNVSSDEGTLFPAANMADKQGQLEKWLGLDFTSFTNSVVFGQGLGALFASANLSDADRKAIFDKIYGLEDYDYALAALLGEYAQKTTALSLHKATTDNTTTALNREQEELQKAADAASRWFDNHQAEVSAKKAAEEAAGQELERCLTKYEEAMDIKRGTPCHVKVVVPPELQDFKDLLKEQRISRDSYKDKLDEVTISVKASQRELGALAKGLDNQTCPTCGQELQSKKAMEERVATLTEEIAELEAQARWRSQEFNDATGVVADIEKEAAALEASYKASLEEYMTQKEAFDKAESAVSLARVRMEAAERAHTLAVKTTQDVAKAENPFEEQVVERAERITKLQEALIMDEKLMADMEHEVKVLTFWKTGFGAKGIKGFILETLLPEFNTLANDHLFALSDGNLSMEVKAFTTLKKGTTAERMTVSVLNEKGAEVYNGNSGGEKRRIDLAILLALQELVARRASQSINFGVYDEVLDALDEDGLTRVISHLKKLSVDRPTFVISHSDAAKALVDDVVTV